MEKKDIKVHAHRGASAYAPENTPASFRLAKEMGSDGIECDIHLSRDGVFVVCHDETIDRTSTGTGTIGQMDYADILRSDFGVRMNPLFAGQHAPTLEEMLDVVQDMDPINIEIKEFAGDEGAALDRFYDVLVKYDCVARVIVSSFNEKILKHLKALHPDLKTGYLYVACSELPEDVQAELRHAEEKAAGGELPKFLQMLRQAPERDVVAYAMAHGCDAIHPCLKFLTEETVQRAHAKGLTVNCWTPCSRAEIAHGIALGCDGIITNNPDWALLLLGK